MMIGWLALACSSNGAKKSPLPPASPAGSGGTGAAGGSGGSAPPVAGTGGATDSRTIGTEVDATTPMDVAADRPAADLAMSGGDAMARPDGLVIDAPHDGMYWQVNCLAGWPKSQCCELYCACMAQNCSKELPSNCISACNSQTSWTLDCRVHNCYLSISPNAPQDHDSHCGHANGKNGKCK
jgi:hypothetical protein